MIYVVFSISRNSSPLGYVRLNSDVSIAYLRFRLEFHLVCIFCLNSYWRFIFSILAPFVPMYKNLLLRGDLWSNLDARFCRNSPCSFVFLCFSFHPRVLLNQRSFSILSKRSFTFLSWSETEIYTIFERFRVLLGYLLISCYKVFSYFYNFYTRYLRNLIY